MACIYIVAESESDTLFYVACAERIKGTAFDFEHYTSRRGTGIHQARRMLHYMLADVRNASAGGPGIFWIAALDNDRAPQHPDGARPPGKLSGIDQRKTNRHLELQAEVTKQNISCPGAIAVPVEMIESWVLQALSPNKALELPPFAEQTGALAITYYKQNRNATPPPQLKDLAKEAMKQSGCANWAEFLIEVASTLDADALAAQSRSFAMFRDALAAWQVA